MSFWYKQSKRFCHLHHERVFRLPECEISPAPYRPQPDVGDDVGPYQRAPG